MRVPYHVPTVAKKKLTKSVERALRDLGRLGGQTRAKRLSAEQRSEIARKAAQARWNRRPKGPVDA